MNAWELFWLIALAVVILGIAFQLGRLSAFHQATKLLKEKKMGRYNDKETK